MKYRHTDAERFAQFENMLVDICARLRGPASKNNDQMYTITHRIAYQAMVHEAVKHMPIVQGGPDFAYTEIPDADRMAHEDANGNIRYNDLILDLLWRAELYRRGETFDNHTKGICDISWRILAATGAALEDYEEGSSLTDFIDGIDLTSSVLRGEQSGRNDVIRLLQIQNMYGTKTQEYRVTYPYPNDIEQVLCTSEHGRVKTQAGLIGDDGHLIMRVEDEHFTIYQAITPSAAMGLRGRPFSVLVEHPLFHGLNLTIRDIETKSDRTIVQLEGMQIRNLRWEEKNSGIPGSP